MTSIIVVNYNSGSLLADCVRSVRKFTTNYELIIVDNASTDHSVDRLSVADNVKIIKNEMNLGFARANNIGIIRANGHYVVLLNSDTRVTDHWLDHLKSCCEAGSNIAIVTPKLLRGDNTVDSTGHVFRFRDVFVQDRGSGTREIAKYDQGTELVSCGFACVLVKRNVFHQVGLLDEKMFFYFEDVDFCVRAKLAGWRIVYCPKSIVYHRRGGSSVGLEGQRLVMKSRAYALRIIIKNYSTLNALKFGALHSLRLIMGLIVGLRNRDLNYVKSTSHALLWNLTNIPLEERLKVQRLRRVSDVWLNQRGFRYPQGQTLTSKPIRI